MIMLTAGIAASLTDPIIILIGLCGMFIRPYWGALVLAALGASATTLIVLQLSPVYGAEDFFRIFPFQIIALLIWSSIGWAIGRAYRRRKAR